jgi:ketosteroid isomerase-like protein
MTKAPAWAARAALACAAVLLAACGRTGPRHHVITAKVIDTIKAGEVRWNEDYKSGDAGRILAHFSADATVMTPGAAPVTGARALRARVVQALQSPQVRLSFSSEDVEVPRSGEFAAVRGVYAWTGAAPPTGAARREAGSYVALYKPAGDGRWLVSWLAITPGAPGVAPAP